MYIRDARSGLKYLGLTLKANDYRKNDWMWLLAKVKK
jgi:hypothetical protein